MPISFSATTYVDAPPATVWARIADVRHWGDWLPTVTSVTPTDPARADGVGAHYVVVQPRLPTATWEISSLEPGREFTWVSSAPGLASTATHVVAPTADGTGCEVTLAIQWRGIGAPLSRLVYGGLAQRYVDTEAATLKQRSESDAHPPATSASDA